MPRTSSIGLAAATTRSAKLSASSSGAVTRPHDRPRRPERRAQLAALAVGRERQRADRDHHRVARPDLHERLRRARGPHADRHHELVVVPARCAWGRPGTRRVAACAVPPVLASSMRAPSISSGGSESPAGEAVPRLPPIVPRLRICGEPTVREAAASAGSAEATSPRGGLRVGERRPEHELVALVAPAAQLLHAPEVDQGAGPLALGVERDHEIRAARDRARARVVGPQVQCLLERARCVDLHAHTLGRFRRGRLTCPPRRMRQVGLEQPHEVVDNRTNEHQTRRPCAAFSLPAAFVCSLPASARPPRSRRSST